MRVILKSVSITLLFFTGLIYCIAGGWDLVPHGELIEGVAWYFLCISPYVWVSYLRSHGAAFEVIPRESHISFSQGAIFLGIIAIAATFGLLLKSKIAYWTWVILLVIGGVSVAGYVVAASPGGDLSTVAFPMCWELLYVGAFALATRTSEEADSLSGDSALRSE